MLEDIAKIKAIRKSILEMVYRAKTSHIGGAYSIVELLYVLYFKVMNIDPINPKAEERDRFLLSKAHGSAALYATLAHKNFYPLEHLERYCVNDGLLPGHLDYTTIAGVEVSAGSLGHGFPLALGMALAAKRLQANYQTYCIVGDGECNEGSIWETAMLGSSLALDNLTVIVDFNKIQSFGRTNDIIDQTNMAERWKAFGWQVYEIDGHDLMAIETALRADSHGKPKAIVAHTVKGRGVSFMEDKLLWHYKSPSDEELNIALAELT